MRLLEYNIIINSESAKKLLLNVLKLILNYFLQLPDQLLKINMQIHSTQDETAYTHSSNDK